MVYFYTFLSVIVISLVSLVGVFILVWGEARLRKFLLALVSFAAGALLGDVFLHILPELIESEVTPVSIGLWLLGGVWLFFALERLIHFHHGHFDGDEQNVQATRYLILLGDGLHNFLDGLVIAVAFMSSKEVGLATVVAVILHELPQEFGDFAVLLHTGLKAKKALFLNFLSALTALVGAGVGLIVGNLSANTNNTLLILAASSFLYIAMSDLIPQMHKGLHSEKRYWWVDLGMMILGGGVMALLLLLE